jgi:hypothetical protein
LSVALFLRALIAVFCGRLNNLGSYFILSLLHSRMVLHFDFPAVHLRNSSNWVVIGKAAFLY